MFLANSVREKERDCSVAYMYDQADRDRANHSLDHEVRLEDDHNFIKRLLYKNIYCKKT